MSKNPLLEAGAPASSKEFLDIQATIECGFTLKRVRDMTRTYSQFLSASKFEKARPVCAKCPHLTLL